MKKLVPLEILAYIMASIALAVLVVFVSKLIVDGKVFWIEPTDYGTSSQVGDFIAGVVGTFLNIAVLLFVILTFKTQVDEKKEKDMESAVEKAVEYHRENVAHISLIDPAEPDTGYYEGAAAFGVIVKEFRDCLGDIKKYVRHIDVSSVLNAKYKSELQSIINANSLKVTPASLFIIDISYSVVYYGLTNEGQIALKRKYIRSVDSQFYTNLLFYLCLKVENQDGMRWRAWKMVRQLPGKTMTADLVAAYEFIRGRQAELTGRQDHIRKLALGRKYVKPYHMGHQHRLSHYYRHLYQSFKHIRQNQSVSDAIKYDMAKELRSHLSTFEQVLLFINSTTHLGRKWELQQTSKGESMKLISTFNLIKNVPSNHVGGVRYNNFYEEVDYDYEALAKQ